MLWRAVLVILLVALLHNQIYCQTVVSGNESGVWAAEDSPFIVIGDITVPDGEELRIEPGAVILFNDDYRISVNGIIIAEGNEEDSIKFTRRNEDVTWLGIYVYSMEGPDIFSYCIMEFATEVLTCYYSNVTVTNCDLRNNSSRVIGFYGCNFEINNNVFRNNEIELLPLIGFEDSNGEFKCNRVTENNLERGSLLRNDIAEIGSTINFERNIFFGNSGSYCIRTEGGTFRFIGNQICNNSSRGILLGRMVQVSAFRNNTIAHNQRFGIYLDFDAESGILGNVNILNSIIWDNEIAINDMPRLRISYCLYDEIDDGGEGEIEFGDGNIAGEDPHFVNYRNNDFNLRVDSPCIDTGDPDSDPDPDGTRADIGALFRFPDGREDVTIFINQTMINSVGTSESAINVSNEGGDTLRWYVLEDIDWMTCAPTGGALDPGGDTDCIFQLNDDDLDRGGYRAIVNIRSNDIENPNTKIYLFMSVGEGEAPEWIDIPVEVLAMPDERISFDVEGEDPEGDALTIELISNNLPMDSVSFVDQGVGSGRFEWTPSIEDSGEYSATFVLSDGLFFTLSEVSFSVSEGNEVPDQPSTNPLIPNEIELGQAFPNPFNATTTITFGLPRAGYVSMSLFETNGREVLNVVSGHYQAGYSIININSSELSSGIYFVKLSTLDKSLTTKIVSIK